MAATDTEPTDDELAARVARRGDSEGALRAARAAFDRLYGRHAPLLRAFLAARVRRDLLDDLHQDVWRRAWQSLPDRYRGGDFRAWIHKIARNALIDASRRKVAGTLDDGESLADPRDGRPDARLMEGERMAALRRCLERLEERAAALVRGRLGGESYEEICGRLGLDPARAHKLWHKVKGQLKSCVEQALG